MRFEVTDTGIGLTEEEIKKLFQPFVQVDTSSSRKFGGTGLGLAISRKIVGLMGGRIGVHSQPGSGSTFWLELPFAVPPQPAMERSFPGLVFLHTVVAVPNLSQRAVARRAVARLGRELPRRRPTQKELGRSVRHDLRAAVIPLVICDDEMLALGGEELAPPAAHAQGTRAVHRARRTPARSARMPPARTTWPTCCSSRCANRRCLTRWSPSSPAFNRSWTGRWKPWTPGRKNGARTRRAKRTAISDLRILAAEDDPFNRRLCQLMLDNFGARAEWAVNGREAVEKFSPGNCDAILMDCNMPELDGFEATAAIRKIEAEQKVARPVRIIALTANALVGERERCLAAGMDDYISKPFTTEQLFNALLAAVPPAAGDAAGRFDAARLEQLCVELERTAVVDMAGDFLNEFPLRLAEIHRLESAGQWPELERAAHSLKGLTALFGFPKLSETFLAIEDAAEAAEAGRVKSALVILDGQAVVAAQQLRGWLKNAGHRPVASTEMAVDYCVQLVMVE